MPDRRIGFIGLGNMGGRITRRLVESGLEILGFDTRPENIAASGAAAAESVSALAAGADVILLSLPDSRVVEAVVDGPDGLIAHSRAGQIVIDLSTAAPDSTRRIAEEFDARGAAFLDAGISGGAAAAEQGRLTLMVGGDATALASVSDVLKPIASQVFHVGASGAGHVTKLLNNFLNAVALSATAEVMIAAKKSGLDLDTVLAVFNESSGVNFATLNRFPKIVHGDYLKGGLTNSLMLKDITLYVDLLARLGVTSFHSAGPVASFGLARALGYADEISNTVVDALGDVSGGVRLHEGNEEDS
ncbi:NAD(P)-dependent oxidoreductase [Leucobacter weissii]|uniref:NAD(P)-dependent oxidoreductase n=1 Tax=Leucobacter weissii TaxID=1983706 RepID=A0A939MLZ0_9MICO|nr:NAD(P)-dependent oxidoreductase [Leucobacter weissii]MBO1902325.1 NAD(P)-dependent oxidoreductase [Leucobacter weissii]